MKKLLSLILIAGALFLWTGATCKQARLEPGGAYALTNAVADIQFYQAEATFSMAYATVDAAFKFEKDNRAALFALNPEIKHSLDKIRPEAVKFRNEYIATRAVYISHPVPTALPVFETILAKIQQLALTAQAAIGSRTAEPAVVKITGQ